MTAGRGHRSPNTWRSARRMKHWQIILMALIAATLGYIYLGSSPGLLKKRKWQSSCAPVIEWLNTQKTETGRYPDILPREYQRVLDRLGPPSEYNQLKQGESFSLSIGDYSARYAFVYYFMPQTGWGIDQ